MASRDGRFIRLAVFRVLLFTAAPAAVVALSITSHPQHNRVPLAVYFVLAIAGVVATNIEIRLSDTIVVLPYNSVIAAAIVLVPSQPWFSVGIISICCSCNVGRLRRLPLYTLLNCAFNLTSGCLALFVVLHVPFTNAGAHVLTIAIVAVMAEILVVVDNSLEFGRRARDEFRTWLPYVFPDFVEAYSGGLAAYAFFAYGIAPTAIATAAIVVTFLVIRDTVDLDHMYDVVIEAFLKAMRAKDEYTYRHSLRVAEECGAFAKFLEWSPNQQRVAYWAGAMHDIGKLSVSIRLIRKNGRFTDEEYNEMKSHNIIVLAILGTVGFLTNLVETAADKWAHYNNRTQGTGNEIAEMVAMLDAKDAMASTRSYHQPKTKEQTMGELFRCRRKQFNPYLVRQYFRFVRETNRNFGLGYEDDKVDFGYEPPTTGFESAGLGNVEASDASIKKRWGVIGEPVNPDPVKAHEKLEQQQ